MAAPTEWRWSDFPVELDGQRLCVVFEIRAVAERRGGLMHRGFRFVEVGVTDIGAELLGRRPGGSDRVYHAVVAGHAHGPGRIRNRRIVLGDAGPQQPLLIQLIRHADTVRPHVFPVLGLDGGGQCGGGAFVLDHQFVEAVPAGARRADVHVPAFSHLVSQREIEHVRQRQIERGFIAGAAQSREIADLGVAFQGVIDLRMVGDAGAGFVVEIEQQADQIWLKRFEKGLAKYFY
jgi:hypothetical protein